MGWRRRRKDDDERRDDGARRAVLEASALEARELLLVHEAPAHARLEAGRRLQRRVHTGE
jgi:hypothetical protein